LRLKLFMLLLKTSHRMNDMRLCRKCAVLPYQFQAILQKVLEKLEMISNGIFVLPRVRFLNCKRRLRLRIRWNIFKKNRRSC